MRKSTSLEPLVERLYLLRAATYDADVLVYNPRTLQGLGLTADIKASRSQCML